jgi:hypothetical protein
VISRRVVCSVGPERAEGEDNSTNNAQRRGSTSGFPIRRARARLRQGPRALKRRHRDKDTLADAILSVATDVLLVINGHSGEIERANPTAYEVFATDSLVGQHINSLMPYGSRALHDTERAAFMLRPEARPMGPHRRVLAQRPSGPFEIEAGLMPLDRGRVLFIARPVA